jgi:thiol-disulfide isomerase/thioredoxin
MMARQSGRVTFSALYNRYQKSSSDREYLAQLYEAFFAIPGYLSSAFRTRGAIPSVPELSKRFGLTEESIDLLLDVMESDSRMPLLFERDPKTGTIVSLNLAALDEFTSIPGTEVRLRGWWGAKLPDFTLETTSGQRMSAADLAGKPALIVVWLTGCPDCRRTLPNVLALHKNYHDQGFQVIGFNVDQALGLDVTAAERKEFATSLGLEFPTLLLDAKTRARFGNLNVYPALIFVDAEGVVDRLMLNYQDLGTLNQIAAALFAVSTGKR